MDFRIKHKRDGLKARSLGFSLAELLVATTILAIIGVSLYMGVVAGFALVKWTQENSRATQILTEKSEEFRLFRWADITNNVFPTNFQVPFNPDTNSQNVGFMYWGTVTISDPPLSTESYASQVKMVTISLSWTNGLVPRTRELKLLVSRDGLHNFKQ
jgi:prepilin-type N-terminal cleavage/methylation domain-containing protein